MSLPQIDLTTDKHGLPALQLSGTVKLTLPLASSSGHAVKLQMAEALVDQLRADFESELPESWSTQAAWDNVIQLKPVADKVALAGHLALSIYGWLAGAEAAGQTPEQWLSSQLPPRNRRPGQITESIWTVLEGRPTDDLRLLGAVASQARGAQAWEALDKNQPAGVRGGHQEIWTDDLSDHLSQAVGNLTKVAPAAVWLRPQSPLDWPALASQLKPEVLVDPYSIKDEAAWRRLHLELAGRRLATSLWASEELLAGATLTADMAHGIVWQPTRYPTLTDFLQTWQEAVAEGCQTMLVEPETAGDSAWLVSLATVLGAEYIWRGKA